MATVVVCHNFNTLKVKVTPSTVLNDVLSQSLNRFGLSGEKDGGGKWALMHGDRSMELDLPWRMMNLPTGIKLQLSQLSAAHGPEAPRVIKVRVQVPGYNSLVREVDVAQNLQLFLQELADENGWPLRDPDAKLQIFTKTIPVRDLRDQTLASLGVVDSLSVRLVLPTGGATGGTTGASGGTEAEPSAGGAPERPVTTQGAGHPLHCVSAYVPLEGSLASQLKADPMDAHELTVEHARRYQQMVSKQTGGLGGPMVPRRLKEQQEAAAARKRTIQECLVRVRFSDRTHIEVAFKPDDTAQTVYQVIAGSLVNESLDFAIFQSHPYVALPADDRKLVDDWQFGAKTLLLFESKSKGPYLKSNILQNAKSLADADDVKLDRSEMVRKPDDERNTARDEPEPQHHAPSAPTTPGKYPKWLKLSKK